MFCPVDATAKSRPPMPDGRNHIKATTAEDRDCRSLPRPQQLSSILCQGPFGKLDGGHLGAHPGDHGWEEQPPPTTSMQKGAVDFGAVSQAEAKFQMRLGVRSLCFPAFSEPSLQTAQPFLKVQVPSTLRKLPPMPRWF